MKQLRLADPVPGGTIASELAALRPLTKFRGLVVVQFAAEECPRTMNEVGRLREKLFRASGAGRGNAIDVDSLDYGEGAYRQLVAFDPQAQELVAMVRFQRGREALARGVHVLRTSSLFDYSSTFIRDVMPRGVELGRSVVSDEAKRARVGLFALWRGLAALSMGEEPFEYFFGNVTIYRDYPTDARDLLVSTVEHLYGPPEPLFLAKDGLRLSPEAPPALPEMSWTEARQGVSHIQSTLSRWGVKMPSILQSYLSLSLGVWCGQTVRDADFGDAYEMAIVVPLSAMEERARRLFGLPVP